MKPTDSAASESGADDGTKAGAVSTSVEAARGIWSTAAIGFLVAFPLLLLFFTRQPLIYDNDSYFHLAIGRLFANQGLIDHLPSLRFSLLGDGFGDKEILFHILLAPFAAMDDFVLGGQIFHSLLLAVIFGVFGALAGRAIGGWGLLAPWILVVVSTEVAWRWVRLRPELLALLLFLIALELIARDRFRWLGAVALVFTLGYTAFHAFLGLCGLQFLFTGWVRRRWHLGLVLYPAIGVGLGLVLHPHFPHNLEVWVLQSFDFFQERGALDVGTEIRPNTTDVTLMVQLGWFLLLAVLWRSSGPAISGAEDGIATKPENPADARRAEVFGLAATVFGLLYLLMSRFSIYFFPLASLWLLFEIRRRGRRIGARTRLPGRGWVPLPLAILLCLAIATPEARRQLGNYRQRNSAGPEEIRLRDREQLAAVLPEGARVAARWQQTPIFLLWAPHGRYLNVLDPIFMARPFPEAHEAQRAVFSGREPDVPLRLVTDLDSNYLAYSRTAPTGRLTERLQHDPRIVRRHWSQNGLIEVLPRHNQALILDWRVVPDSIEPGDIGDSGLEESLDQSWPAYPLHPSAIGRAVEGFVDLRRVTAEDCATVTRVEPGDASAPRTLSLELVPWGRAELWIDDRMVLEMGGASEAVLGQGSRVNLGAAEGPTRWTIRTCSGPGEPLGFYLRRQAS